MLIHWYVWGETDSWIFVIKTTCLYCLCRWVSMCHLCRHSFDTNSRRKTRRSFNCLPYSETLVYAVTLQNHTVSTVHQTCDVNNPQLHMELEILQKINYLIFCAKKLHFSIISHSETLLGGVHDVLFVIRFTYIISFIHYISFFPDKQHPPSTTVKLCLVTWSVLVHNTLFLLQLKSHIVWLLSGFRLSI